MTPEQIFAKAESLRSRGIDTGNYRQVVNDTLVLIRELARSQMIAVGAEPPKTLTHPHRFSDEE